MIRIFRNFTFFAVSFALALDASAQAPQWTPRTIDLFGSLPVQEGGRIKPISTFADFTLLRLSGKKSLTRSDGKRVTSTEWLLEQIFFPEQAADELVFLVSDDAVIDAIGVAHEGKKKRDRYSLRQIEPGIQKLLTLAGQYGHIEEKNRSTLQQQVVDLAEAVQIYDSTSGRLDLAVVPPEVDSKQDPEWSTPEELFTISNAPKIKRSEKQERILAGFHELVQKRTDPNAFEAVLASTGSEIIELADARGEYSKIPLERLYYRADFLFWAQMVFLCAFLSVTAAWLFPRAKLPYLSTAFLAGLGALALVSAITIRCIIRDRPPVSTLYETVLFITAVGAIVALVAERLTRQRIALSAAAVLGMVGVFIANGYETLDKRDTMPSLVAVLDTNFWLATHVTAVTVGYSAGMLAALLASFYLVSKTFGFRRNDPRFYSSISRMVYGVLCFGVIFSTVGTILGGIWANDSWGRFWGWDPKENGALLIVISQLVILHGRMGGYLKEHGVCAAAALSGTIVAFSWFGVNLLGVGLHSYGFTSGIHTALWTYYYIQWGIVAIGTYAWWRTTHHSTQPPPSAG